ncbi:MAG: serine hydrolase [Proteobacteria bacterium]|nr:serine hydrolase [Pseudomonadota bacterium]
MRNANCVIVLLLLATNTAWAQFTESDSPDSTGFVLERLGRIDAVINAEIASGKIPGAVALVARNGKIAYFKSFGFADIESQTPMQKDNMFRIASMTKAITSVGVMILYERGLFQLNDPVSKYIPEYADMRVVSEVDANGNVSATVPATAEIKIIDLLTHSSGISYPFYSTSLQKSYVDAGIIDGMTSKDITLAAQMRLLAAQPLLFEPGSEYSYGLSVDLLGYLIEVVSGKPLDQFFNEEIFTQLGMQDSYFYLPKAKFDRLVTLYAEVDEAGLIVSRGDESNIILDNPRYPVGNGQTYFSGGAGLSSTAYDYARFLQMLLNNGELDGSRILSRKSVELMQSARIDSDGDQIPDFGLGFEVINDLGKSGELGSIGSYSWGGAFLTDYWIDPSENLIAVFMSQVRPSQSDIRVKFNTMVYQALE